MKIAACQYHLEVLTSWDNYTAKIESLVIQAAKQDARLLLLPEYAGVEVACGKFPSDAAMYKKLQPLIPKYIDFYKNLARQYQIYIQPGTIMFAITSGQYVNRAYFFGPEGMHGFQDKLQLIEYEKESCLLQSGKDQTVFNTALGVIGIAICYDSEFPEVVRRLVRAGANLILVPSYTTSLAGYHRVFLSCRARAIENQCYVAISYIVGTVDLGGGIENTVGQAVILGPADEGFPDDGIIAQGNMNQEMIIAADISFEKLLSVRKSGQVHNHEDMQRFELSRKNNVNTFSL